MNFKCVLIATAICTLAQLALAAVGAEEAAKLKLELTPTGAERAQNKDGSIPAWTGGYTTPIPGDKPGGRRGDPFKDEKPILSITPKNFTQYEDKLTDGTQAMFRKFPDYRVNIYKTHRTFAAPQWVYENTFKNATRAVAGSDGLKGAYGGVPFPIPKSGEEVMWNHVLRWRGASWQFISNHYQITADGRAVMTTDGIGDQQMPYYFQDGSVEQFQKGDGAYWLVRVTNLGPPIRAGEAIVGRLNINSDKDLTWVYLTGQRRVRKLPNPCCDTPTPATAGVMMFDELQTFTGRLDRFNWKILGKKEMFIPYNGNKELQPKSDAEVIGKYFMNPDHVRWELHRVWVVEATLKPGQRHLAARSRYYCDEDSWYCILGDRWDSRGELWRTVWDHPFVAPDMPGFGDGAMGFTDLLTGSGYIGNLFNSKPAQYPLKAHFSDSTFTPDAMSAESVR
jgi:hypothetical protein